MPEIQNISNFVFLIKLQDKLIQKKTKIIVIMEKGKHNA